MARIAGTGRRAGGWPTRPAPQRPSLRIENVFNCHGDTMKVQIYGTGCARCSALEKAAKEAIKEMGVDVEVVKVSDIGEIVAAGILAPPGFAVDGAVKSMGRVPSKDELKKWIKEKM
jgi:small redox-active disulfide protein 2